MTNPVAFDTHLHLYRTAAEGRQGKAGYEIWEYGARPDVHFSDDLGDPESALKAMDRAGVQAAVVTNLLDVVRPGVPANQDLIEFNHWLCDLAKENPRFIPLIAVDPNVMSVTDCVAHLEDMVEHHGARGIKIHPPLQRLDLSDQRIWPLFDACQRMALVIVSHSGPSRDGSGRGGPDSFRPMLGAFPSLRIVLAHMGGAAWRQLPALSRDFPDVRFDLCEIIEWLGAPNAPTADQFSSLIREVGPDRVMLGSDFPWYDIEHTISMLLYLPKLATSEKQAILGENAAEFFRVDR